MKTYTAPEVLEPTEVKGTGPLKEGGTFLHPAFGQITAAQALGAPLPLQLESGEPEPLTDVRD